MTPTEATGRFFKRAADLLGLSDLERKQLLTPFREIRAEPSCATMARPPRSSAIAFNILRKVMRNAYADIFAVRTKHNCDLRTAAFTLAVDRVATATRLRGL